MQKNLNFNCEERNALQNRHTKWWHVLRAYKGKRCTSGASSHECADAVFANIFQNKHASTKTQRRKRMHTTVSSHDWLLKTCFTQIQEPSFSSSLISLLYAAFFTLWCKQIPHILSHRSIPPATPTLRFYSPLCPPPAPHHDPASNVSPALPPLVDMELSMATAGQKLWPSAFALPFSLACYPCPEYSKEQRRAHPHLTHSSIHMQILCGQWKYDGMCAQMSTTTLHDSHLLGKETSLRACVVIFCRGKKNCWA